MIRVLLRSWNNGATDAGVIIIRRNKSSRESSALIDAEQILLKEKEIAELKKRIEENTNKDIKELKQCAIPMKNNFSYRGNLIWVNIIQSWLHT